MHPGEVAATPPSSHDKRNETSEQIDDRNADEARNVGNSEVKEAAEQALQSAKDENTGEEVMEVEQARNVGNSEVKGAVEQALQSTKDENTGEEVMEVEQARNVGNSEVKEAVEQALQSTKDENTGEEGPVETLLPSTNCEHTENEDEKVKQHPSLLSDEKDESAAVEQPEASNQSDKAVISHHPGINTTGAVGIEAATAASAVDAIDSTVHVTPALEHRPVPSDANENELATLEYLSTKVDPIFTPLLNQLIIEVSDVSNCLRFGFLLYPTYGAKNIEFFVSYVAKKPDDVKKFVMTYLNS